LIRVNLPFKLPDGTEGLFGQVAAQGKKQKVAGQVDLDHCTETLFEMA
jgi:hypothetical protein